MNDEQQFTFFCSYLNMLFLGQKEFELIPRPNNNDSTSFKIPKHIPTNIYQKLIPLIKAKAKYEKYPQYLKYM